MAVAHLYRTLLGRNMIETIAEEAGAFLPVAQGAPTLGPASPVTPSAPAAANGAPDVVYTYSTPGMEPGTVYDVATRQPVSVYVSDGYVPVMVNGEGTGYESVISQSLMNVIRSVPPLRDNRGGILYPSVYVSTAALNAYRPSDYLYQAPAASYAPTPGAAPLSPQIPSWASGGRQQTTNRPSVTALVTAPAPPSAAPPAPSPSVPPPSVFSPQPSSSGTPGAWTSDDGGPSSGSNLAPVAAPAEAGKGWLILAAIAAAVLSQ